MTEGKNSEVMKRIAVAIAKAAKIKEESYDHKAADRAAKSKAGREGYVDYKKFYTKTLKQAIEQALAEEKLDPRWCELIYLALDSWWNDTLEWTEIICPGLAVKLGIVE